ncbi:arylsulfatase [Methylomicrobium lacus]|uniref:arylsulfatase n=1 Tax=Methylomicrobium lacus TaxID=136992 RepID=UPI0035A97A59
MTASPSHCLSKTLSSPSVFNAPKIGLAGIAVAALSACAVTPQPPLAGSKPNILYIIADDLGYSDIGAFGGEISTPNLDALVRSGRILTNYHTSTVCAVTRSMLYSGTDHHLVGEGTMGPPNDERKGLPGYEGYLNNQALSIAELLRDAGYHTYIAGKWHLGSKINAKEDKTPDQWGFEHSFTLLGGATGNHFGHDRASDKTYTENGRFVSLPATDNAGRPWYDTHVYTQKLIANIDEHIKDGKPFAAFATYTSPHWPLQVPEPWASQYKGAYDAGYEVIRQRRLDKQKQLGFVPADYTLPGQLLPNAASASPATANFGRPNARYINADTVPGQHTDNVDYGPGNINLTWAQLPPAQKKLQARYMEIYAGMVSNLDYNIGLLIQHLKDIGQYDNTFIVFHSDNGAEGSRVSAEQEAANARNIASLGRDQTLNPPGTEKTYIRYGWRWAEVSATPFRLVKGFTTEGGTSVPMVVHLPGQSAAQTPVREFAHVRDAAPTLLEMAGIAQPLAPAGVSGVNGIPLVKYKDRNVYPITGHSFLGELRGRHAAPLHPEPVGEEQYGRTYLRSGPWKIVWTEPPLGPSDGHWQLYNIEQDRTETRDLAAQHPEVVATLYRQWQSYMHDSGAVLAKKPGNTGRLPAPPR